MRGSGVGVRRSRGRTVGVGAAAVGGRARCRPAGSRQCRAGGAPRPGRSALTERRRWSQRHEGSCGRGARIRTGDLLVPNQARCQTALHPATGYEYTGPARRAVTDRVRPRRRRRRGARLALLVPVRAADRRPETAPGRRAIARHTVRFAGVLAEPVLAARSLKPRPSPALHCRHASATTACAAAARLRPRSRPLPDRPGHRPAVRRLDGRPRADRGPADRRGAAPGPGRRLRRRRARPAAARGRRALDRHGPLGDAPARCAAPGRPRGRHPPAVPGRDVRRGGDALHAVPPRGPGPRHRRGPPRAPAGRPAGDGGAEPLRLAGACAPDAARAAVDLRFRASAGPARPPLRHGGGGRLGRPVRHPAGRRGAAPLPGRQGRPARPRRRARPHDLHVPAPDHQARRDRLRPESSRYLPRVSAKSRISSARAAHPSIGIAL